MRSAYVQRKVLVAGRERSKRNVLPSDRSEMGNFDPYFSVSEAAGAAASLANEHHQGTADEPGPSGLVWIYSPFPVVAIGLEKTLEGRARVYEGREAPADTPSWT